MNTRCLLRPFVFWALFTAAPVFLCLSCASVETPEPQAAEELSPGEPHVVDTIVIDTEEASFGGSSDGSSTLDIQPVSPATAEPAESESLPPGIFFSPEDFTIPEIALGVGQITRDRSDFSATLASNERALVSASFRAAYIDGLLGGIPLAGVLGGDEVHGWPARNPSAWAQNWRTARPAANSWGSPSLILAVHGFGTDNAIHGRVFIVHGKILDYYGRNAGLGRANGIAGYGAPRGNEFPLNGQIAQHFDHGLITISEEGQGAFIPGPPPSSEIEVPADIGLFPNAGTDGSREMIRPAFIEAWKMAVDRSIASLAASPAEALAETRINPIVPDGPGQYLSFQGGAGVQDLRGLYVQSFNQREMLLVLPDSPSLPPFPRVISSPVLEALLQVPQALPREIRLSGGDTFARELAAGFVLYGIPLSDPMPVEAEDGERHLAQRFSRGWLTWRVPKQEPPVVSDYSDDQETSEAGARQTHE